MHGYTSQEGRHGPAEIPGGLTMCTGHAGHLDRTAMRFVLAANVHQSSTSTC